MIVLHVSIFNYCLNYFICYGVRITNSILFYNRCRQWVINCRRADLDKVPVEQLNRNYYLCAEHFETNQFCNANHNSLLWNAVPTLFNISNPPKKLAPTRKPPAKRQPYSSSKRKPSLPHGN